MPDRFTEAREKLATQLGVDLADLTPRLAALRLRLKVIEEITPPDELLSTTENQRALATQLGIESISGSRVVATTQIQEVLERRNHEAMTRYRFRPGMRVRITNKPQVREYTPPREVGSEHIVSSVSSTGRIYLRGASGAFEYASCLEPVDPESEPQNPECRRICPMPTVWGSIYFKLCRYAESHVCQPSEPPTPLILGGWHVVDIIKQLRWTETVEWATNNYCASLVAVADEDWYLEQR